MLKIIISIKTIKIYFIAIISIILFSVAFLYFRMPKESSAVTAVLPNPTQLENLNIMIDSSDDIASLGFPPQRKMVMDNKGNIFVAYRKKFNGNFEIFVAKVSKQDGKLVVSGNEKPIVQIGGNAQRVPAIDIDSRDGLHVIWYGADNNTREGNRQIKYIQSQDGGQTWSEWLNISPVESYNNGDYWQEHPYISVGEEDELYVVWEGEDSQNNNQQIKFTKSQNRGKSWSHWQNISVTPGATQSRPVILQDRAGTVHVLMYSSLGKNIQQIQHSFSFNDGQNWSEWQNISNSFFDARHLSAIIDKNNLIHVVWRSTTPLGRTQIYYSFSNKGQWSEPKLIAASSRNQFFPSISIDESNNLYVTWMETDKNYDLPREKPEEGQIYTVKIQNGQIEKPKLQSQGEKNLYPSLPAKIVEINNLFLIYGNIPDKNNEFIDIILKKIN